MHPAVPDVAAQLPQCGGMVVVGDVVQRVLVSAL